MDDFQRELLARLPLAQAVFHLFSYVLNGEALGRLYETYRGRCYERELTFEHLVYLVRDALLVHGGSAGQCFEHAGQAGELPVAPQNAYAKLSRLPLPLSVALLREGSAALAGLMPDSPSPLPASLSGLRAVVLDGKKLKELAKRLAPCRGLPGKLLGPKLLAALDLRSGLVLAMSVCEDGEANDVPLVPALLPQVRAQLAAVILWVADAQFCDLNLPLLFTQEGGHFLLRYTKKLGFHPDPLRPAREGVDASGRRFVQEWGHVGNAKDKRRRYVRRVTLLRPDDQGGDVSVITDLLEEKDYPAADLLELYLMRWGIERVFQQVTEVFELRRLIGCTPNAAAFQAAFCLLLYDMIQVAKAYAAQAAGRQAEEVSGEKLFDDTRRQLAAWAAVGEPAYAAAYLARPPAARALRRMLERWVGGSWTERWVKKKNKNPRRHKPKAKRSGAHTSVWRVLQAHRAAKQATPARQRQVRS